MSKNKESKKNERAQSLNSFKTEEKLSKGNCETAFHNMLRGGKNGHPETKMVFVPLKVSRHRSQISHIFSGEDPSTIKETQKRHIKHEKSKVMFNDAYYEKNPKINPQKLARYNFEQKYKKNAIYSDELHIGEGRKKLLERKINDNYKRNPMKILNKDENVKYNNEIALKNQKRGQVYKKMLGSEGCRRILGGIKPKGINDENNQYNKITNNNFNITQKSLSLNKNKTNDVLYYGRKHHRYASCGEGNGFTFC